MSKRIRSLVFTFVLGASVWTLAIVEFDGVSSAFSDGETVSAGAFNALFEAIDANFGAAKAAIDANEADIGSLQAFDAAVAAGTCPSGEAMQSIMPGGAVSCTPAEGDASPVPAVSATASSNISVPSGSGLVVPFDAEFFDTTDMHSVGSDATEFVISEDGIYHVSANVAWSTSLLEGINQILVRVNGTVSGPSDHRASSGVTIQSVSGLLLLEEGDVLNLTVFQTSGSDSLILASPLRMSIAKIASLP